MVRERIPLSAEVKRETETTVPSSHLSQFGLDPSVTYLNHGSFGACPRAIMELQTELRSEMEKEPVQFLVHKVPQRLDEARHAVAGFLNCDPEGLAFVANATTGVNAVLRSLPFTAGDELLVTDHEYNACRNVMDYVAEQSGAKVVVVPIPFPIADERRALESILAKLTPRSRLLLVDHVTSATGMVMPIQAIVSAVEAKGVPVLVDGAHAMGMVPVDLKEIGAAFYTSNAHKWLCAPKGAAVLSVRNDWVARIRPAVISHGANMPTTTRSRFRHEFDWMGTSDPTPWLCVPACLRFLSGLHPDGIDGLRRRNRELVLAGRDLLLAWTGQSAPTPDSMIGSLASVPISDGPAGEPSPLYVDPLQQRLWDQFRIEVPIHPFPAPPRRLIRISAQAYNDLGDYQKLVGALRALEGR
jgi:isopenicillin-N epimerase